MFIDFRIVTHFCKWLRAPQKRALSGTGNSVLLLESSGLMILMQVSCPRYHLSKLSVLRFQTPTLSSDTQTADHPPENTFSVGKICVIQCLCLKSITKHVKMHDIPGQWSEILRPTCCTSLCCSQSTHRSPFWDHQS